MAYDRYDRSDERSRWRGNDDFDRSDRNFRNPREERGFFERAGDEISSWFGDDDAERRRREDNQRERSFGDRDRFSGNRDFNRDREWDSNRGGFAASSDRDYGRDRWRDDRYRDNRPMNRDYERLSDSDRNYASSGIAQTGRFGQYHRDGDRSQTPWGRDDYRRTSSASGSDRQSDPHYLNWRDRQMSELDRDYDDYRNENQSKFESDFGNWRDRRQQKRGLLGQIREHMEVVGSDDEHVGTVDKIAGDRIVLTKSDPDAGGSHHSLSCSDVDRIDGDRVILDSSADQARKNWRDESRSRALFERDDQGEAGPRMLDRSFEGTYR